MDERICRRCFVMEGCAKCAEKTKEFFGFDTYEVDEKNGTFAFISRPMNNKEANEAVAGCKKTLCWAMPVLD